MDEGQQNKLKGIYLAVLGIRKIFDDDGSNPFVINADPVNVLGNELLALEQEFPGLVPIFNAQQYYDGENYYRVAGIRAHIEVVLGKIKVILEESQNEPVTERKEFSFIAEPRLRVILERDYIEIQRAYVVQCWKSVIILSGGAIEAMLTNELMNNESQAKAASKAPPKKDITKWVLNDLIEVSVELKLISQGVDRFSHSLRAYRNLVHPGNEIQENLKFGAEEARISIEIVNMLHRDLSV